MPATTSAWVSFHSSGHAPLSRPAANSIVPYPPSKTRISPALTRSTTCQPRGFMRRLSRARRSSPPRPWLSRPRASRSEEHTSELQSRENLVCRLLLEKKKIEQEKVNFLLYEILYKSL